MPLYAYQCEDCHQHFHVRKSMAEMDSVSHCPDCGSSRTNRMISAVAVFSSSGSGQKRALAGASGCAGCSLTGSACASCHPR